MNKLILAIRGYLNCLSWVLFETIKYIWDECPDLKFWNIPTHPADFLWYAERINGRVAMITLSSVLWLELLTGKGIWELVCG